jgi:carbon monoxide dehydrogenase subunit G
MIETEQSVVIDAPIEKVWDHVKDIRKWAELVPGMRECTVIDTNDSRWLIKVGVGGLVRTATVLVHVDQWSGPERVDFSYTLDGDPVIGGGSYVASRKSAYETEVTMTVRVEGSGPVAPLWEAMCKPLLPQLAKSFAGKLKAEIEKAGTGVPSQPAETPSAFRAIWQWLRSLWHSILGKQE